MLHIEYFLAMIIDFSTPPVLEVYLFLCESTIHHEQLKTSRPEFKKRRY